MNEKVFISCPINCRKDYVLKDYFHNILSFTHPYKHYYFDDNSTDEKFHRTLIKSYGFEIGYSSPKGLTPILYMCNSMNKCLKKFLESDCEYWLIVECDLLPPKDIIEQLISHDKVICGAPYMIGQGSDSFIMTTEFETVLGTTNLNRKQTTTENYLKHNGLLEKVDGVIGFGCVLIKREVVEGYKFYVNIHSGAHCDSTFYADMHDKGIEVYRDNSIICEHRNQSWETISDK